MTVLNRVLLSWNQSKIRFMKTCDFISRNYIEEESVQTQWQYLIKWNKVYFHIFFWLENFSLSMGKFTERWRLHERCRQGYYRASSFISSLACHFEEGTFAFLIFTTQWGQQRILYQPNPLPQKEQDRVKSGWTAPRLLSETLLFWSPLYSP